jgi:hypothetical protein
VNPATCGFGLFARNELWSPRFGPSCRSGHIAAPPSARARRRRSPAIADWPRARFGAAHKGNCSIRPRRALPASYSDVKPSARKLEPQTANFTDGPAKVDVEVESVGESANTCPVAPADRPSLEVGRVAAPAVWTRGNRPTSSPPVGSFAGSADVRRTQSHDLGIAPLGLARAQRKAKPRRRGSHRGFLEGIRQRPTLPHGFPCSAIGSGGLNFRVRDGNGCGPSDIAAGNSRIRRKSQFHLRRLANLVPLLTLDAVRSSRFKQAARAISTGQLRTLTVLPLPAYRRRSLRRLFRGVVPREVLS